VKQWAPHYNKSRPHSSLGPGIPDPGVQTAGLLANRHCVPSDHRIVVKPILGGLHHEYQLLRIAAWTSLRPNCVGLHFCGRQACSIRCRPVSLRKIPCWSEAPSLLRDCPANSQCPIVATRSSLAKDRRAPRAPAPNSAHSLQRWTLPNRHPS